MAARFPRSLLVSGALLVGSLAASEGCLGRSALRPGGENRSTAGSGGAAAGGSGVAGADAGGRGGEGPRPECWPQDARPEGPCATELPGLRWTGWNCAPLGTGCSCAGRDCDALYGSMAECVAARRGCYRQGCEAQVVHADACIPCSDDDLVGVFWNGRECFELYGCRCAGDDCGRAFASLAECRQVLRHCEGELCLATDGEWFPAPAGFCGFGCGAPLPVNCEAPFDSCRCAPGETFRIDRGCSVDPACTDRDFCLATRGSWHPAAECYCGFVCGEPGPCNGCLDSCYCGPHRNFVAGEGCVVDAGCPAASAAEICVATGGEWYDCSQGGPCSCGDFVCGHPNTLDPCVAPGCDCGRWSNFDPTEGCFFDDRCALRDVGEECHGYGLEWSSCRPGLACCAHCGPALGCTTCDAPCCSEDAACEAATGCLPPP